MHIAIRRAATATAIVSLALLGLRPTHSVTNHPADAIVVTAGASDAAVRRLADSLGVQRVLRLTGRDSLPDVGYVARVWRDPHRLHVIGWGLDPWDWRALGAAPAGFYPSALPAGFTAARWPAQVVLGEEVRVTGQIEGRGPVRVYLGAGRAILDSATTAADGAFALRTRPAATGRQRYAIWSAGTAPETLGVAVTAPPRWRTLLLTAAPSFEAASLRDLLARTGAPVAWRAGISRDRTRLEVVNRPAVALEPLRDAVLAQLDVVVADGRAFEALSPAERTAVLRAVTDSGMGLILLSDDRGASAGKLGFSLAADTALAERLVRPRTAEGRPAASPVPAEPFTLRETFGAGPVLWGAGGEVLAQVRPRGAGRVVLTLVTAPSRWLRAGERSQFALYWTALLGAAARDPAPEHWEIGAGRVRQPVDLAVRATRPRAVALVAGPLGAVDSVYLARDPRDAGRWRGRYWPAVPGWHEIQGAGDAGAFFVSGPLSWRGVQAAGRLEATARWIATAPAAEPQRPPERARRLWPLWWWLGLFVVSTGVLWAERRRTYIRAMPRTAVPAAAAVVSLLVLLGCSKSEDERRQDVDRCAAVNTQAELISLCLLSEHKWKEHEADSAGKLRAHELDSTRTSQEAAMWNSDSVRHKAALRECGRTNDMKECLLVRYGWPSDRATRTADSAWQRNAALHGREIKSCQRGRNPVASCLMLSYKWNAQRAMATEDSLRRARAR